MTMHTGHDQHSAFDQLDQLDQLIDSALATVGRAEPSPTLESRTLRALQALEAAQPPATSRWRFPAFAAAAALVCCALFFALHADHTANSTQHAALLQPPASYLTPRSSPVLPPQALAAQGIAIRSIRSIRLISQPDLLPQARGSQSAALTDPEAALALAETQAASAPSPAMPLSPQERTLISATRNLEFTEMAELQPGREADLRATLEAHQRLAVQRYIHRLLAPLAASESIQPTAPVEPLPASIDLSQNGPASPADTPSATPLSNEPNP